MPINFGHELYGGDYAHRIGALCPYIRAVARGPKAQVLLSRACFELT